MALVMMRAALIVAALALNTCTTAKDVVDTAEADAVKIETVARGSYAVDESPRKAVLAASEAEYRRQWQALIGEGDAPAVDFTSRVAVFLLAGTRNSGGWSVQPAAARVEGRTLVVEAKIQGPPPGSMTTQALTQPWAVIAADVRDVSEVRWAP